MVFPVRILYLAGALSACTVSQTAVDTSTGGDLVEVDVHGSVYVLDRAKSTVCRLDHDFVRQSEIGGPGWQDGRFDNPSGIWARNGIDVFVADYGNHRIQRFDRNLSFVSAFSARESSNPDERFGYPMDVALSRLGDLFICDGENSRIVKLDRFDRIERAFGGFDAGRGRLHAPTNLEIGPKDHLYVLDGNRVLVYDSFGNYLREITEGMNHGDVLIFADDKGLVMLAAGMLYWFDEEVKVRSSIPLDSLGGTAISPPKSLAFSQGWLYLLTDDGVRAVPDPRR
jgi:hypothetical protein